MLTRLGRDRVVVGQNAAAGAVEVAASVGNPVEISEIHLFRAVTTIVCHLCNFFTNFITISHPFSRQPRSDPFPPHSESKIIRDDARFRMFVRPS